MSCFLLITGLIIIFFGGYLLKKENKVYRNERNENKINFQELLEEQNNKEEYIKLLAENQVLKVRLESVETKLDHISVQLDLIGKEHADSLSHSVISDKIEKAGNDKQAAGDTEASLNLRKGEVRCIQNLLKKQKGL